MPRIHFVQVFTMKQFIEQAPKDGDQSVVSQVLNVFYEYDAMGFNGRELKNQIAVVSVDYIGSIWGQQNAREPLRSFPCLGLSHIFRDSAFTPVFSPAHDITVNLNYRQPNREQWQYNF